MKNRSQKALYNIIALSCSEIVIFITSLILPKVILSHFGSAYNGLSLSISQYLKYISVLTIGVVGPTRVALYKTLSKNDTKGTSGIIKATENLYRKIAICFVIYTVAMCIFLPLIKINEFPWFDTLRLVIIISVGSFFDYCFGITYKTLLDADQRMYMYVFIQTIVKVLNVAGSILIITLGGSIYFSTLYGTVCTSISSIIIFVYTRKKYNIIKNVEPNKEGLLQRKDAAASSIANTVHTNTDVFLLTLFADSKVISVYSVYLLVMGGMQSLMRIFTSGLEAAFGNMWAKDERDNMRNKFHIYEYAMNCFVVIAFSCTGVLLLPFIKLYTAGITDVEYIRYPFAILLTVTTAVYCLRQPYLTIVQAAGKYKETRNGAILEAILNFGISLLLVNKFNLIGVTVGTLAANLFRTFQYAYFASHSLKLSDFGKTVKMIIWSISSSALIVLICELIKYTIEINNWFTWIISGVVFVVVAIVVVVLMSLVFYRNELKYFFENILGLIKRLLKI